MPLEKYYVGDTAFAQLVSAYKTEWENCNFKDELLAAVHGDVGIAVVTFGKVEGHALKWLESKVPALDGLTPKECMQTEKGLKRLKECLMRMPC